jgi:hypothetical protein
VRDVRVVGMRPPLSEPREHRPQMELCLYTHTCGCAAPHLFQIMQALTSVVVHPEIDPSTVKGCKHTLKAVLRHIVVYAGPDICGGAP